MIGTFILLPPHVVKHGRFYSPVAEWFKAPHSKCVESFVDGDRGFESYLGHLIDWTKILKDLQKEGFDAKVDSYIDKGDFTQIRLAIYWYSETPN